MARRSALCLAAWTVSVLVGIAAPADTIVLQYDDGAGIDASAHAYQPDTNYDGDVSGLYLYGNEKPPSPINPATSYLRFVLPWVLRDPGVTVQSATLKANLYSWGNWGDSTTATIGVAGVTQSWAEKTLTWNNRPTTDVASTSSATISGIPTGVQATNQWSQWNVKPLVDAWTGGARPNYGMILRVDSPASNRNQFNYYASEATSAELRPVLEIQYTGTPAPQREVALYDWEQTSFSEVEDKVGAGNSYLVTANGNPGTTSFLGGTGGTFSRSTKDVLVGATNWDELKLTGGLTLSAYIRPDASTFSAPQYDNPTIVAKFGKSTAADQERGYVLNLTGGSTSPDRGKLVMGISEAGTSDSVQTVTQDSVTMQADKTYHVTGVFRPGQEIELYIDGLPVKSAPTTLTAINNTPLPLMIGGITWDGGYRNAFGGTIDQVRVLNRAYTDDEVAMLSHELLGPVAVYNWAGHAPGRLEDKAGPVLSDLEAASGKSFPVDAATIKGTGGRFSRSHNGTGDVLQLAAGAPDSDLHFTGQFTAMAWIQADADALGRTGDDNPFLLGRYGTQSNSPTNQRGWMLNLDDGRLQFVVSSDGTYAGATTVSQASATMTAGNLYHVAGVFRPGQELELFINGQSVGSVTTGVPTSVFDSTLPLSMGGMWWSSYWVNLFDGIIADARIYPYAMTDFEVWQVYAAPEPASALLALFGALGLFFWRGCLAGGTGCLSARALARRLAVSSSVAASH